MYDLLVIGGGAGGVSAAMAANRLGAKVAIVDRGPLGGQCGGSSCAPRMALLRAASAAHAARCAGRLGIRVGAVTVDFPAVMARVREVIASVDPPVAADHLRGTGIDLHVGSPAFESYDTVVVDGGVRLSARKFLIATGSRPSVPEIPGLHEVGFLTDQTIWGLEALPESLLVLGGGRVGLELGQAFARLGSQVTILEENAEILPGEETDCASVLRQRLSGDGITFFANVEVTGVGARDGKTLVKFRSKRDVATFEALRSHILVTTGRLANVDGLNLESIGVHASPEAGIPVDDTLATASRHVYAIGEVTGRVRSTLAADGEAEVVAHNVTGRFPKKFRDGALARAIFTDPEFAAVGVTEARARAADPEIRVSSLDLGNVERTGVDGGLAKVVANPAGKILGVTVVGSSASLVLPQFMIAIEHGLTPGELAATARNDPSVATMVAALAKQFALSNRESWPFRSALKTAIRSLAGN